MYSMLIVYDNDENKMDVGMKARPQDRNDDQRKKAPVPAPLLPVPTTLRCPCALVQQP